MCVCAGGMLASYLCVKANIENMCMCACVCKWNSGVVSLQCSQIGRASSHEIFVFVLDSSMIKCNKLECFLLSPIQA